MVAIALKSHIALSQHRVGPFRGEERTTRIERAISFLSPSLSSHFYLSIHLLVCAIISLCIVNSLPQLSPFRPSSLVLSSSKPDAQNPISPEGSPPLSPSHLTTPQALEFDSPRLPLEKLLEPTHRSERFGGQRVAWFCSNHEPTK